MEFYIRHFNKQGQTVPAWAVRFRPFAFANSGRLKLKGGFIMFHNLKRDFSKTLKQQIKEGTSKGWTYIGVFGRGENAILKFISES